MRVVDAKRGVHHLDDKAVADTQALVWRLKRRVEVRDLAVETADPVEVRLQATTLAFEVRTLHPRRERRRCAGAADDRSRPMPRPVLSTVRSQGRCGKSRHQGREAGGNHG
jgi:hypothetical protein